MAYIGNDLRSNEDYKIIDDISSGFNGSATSFALQVGGATPVPFPKFEQQLLISVNGVIQEPDPTGSAGFKLLGTNIVFSSAPTNGHAFFGVIYAGADYVNAGGTFPDGSINFPSITFSADTNTGFTRTGSGTVALISDGNKIAQFPTSQGSSGQALITDGGGNLSFGVPTPTFTSDITISNSVPKLLLVDTGNNPDYDVRNQDGAFVVRDTTNSANRLIVQADGHIDIAGNLDVGAGIDVTGAITGTGDLTIDTNTLHVDSSNNRVGIGTSSPATRLHIEDTAPDLRIKSTNANLGQSDEVGRISIHTSDPTTPTGVGEVFRIKSFSANSNGADYSTELTSRAGSGGGESAIRLGQGAVGAIAFRTNTSGGATERMRIDSSGRVMIGTTTEGHSAADDLTIATSASTGITIRSGTSSEGNIYFSDGTSGASEYPGQVVYDHSANSLSLLANGDLRLRVFDSRIDIQGTHSGNGVSDATLRFAILDSNGNDKKAQIISTKVSDVNSTLEFATTVSNTYGERMRIDSAGGLRINTTSTVIADELFSISESGTVHELCGFRVNNQSHTKDLITMAHVANSGDRMFIRFKRTGSLTNVGSINTNPTATAFNTSSDYRLKENEVLISDGITRLKTLKPYRFNFKIEPDKTVDGFFAHEVASAVPEAITGVKDAVETTYYTNGDTIPDGKAVGDVKEENVILPQGLDYAKFTPLLTAALQEAIAKIEVLETEVAALKAA